MSSFSCDLLDNALRSRIFCDCSSHHAACLCNWSVKKFKRDAKAAAAVEFALVAPLLILLVFGIYAASLMTATVNGLEQLTAGAARSAVAGLSDSERTSLATAYVAANASVYPYIDPTVLVVSTTTDTVNKRFTVSITYDMSTNKLFQVLKGLAPMVPQVLHRQAVVLVGGA